MLTTFLLSVASFILLAVSSDAIDCYEYGCGISTNPFYKFNESCVDPFSTTVTGKAKCNGTQCLTKWWFLWQVVDHANLTTSGVSRTCITGQTMEPLPISTLDDCVGLSQKYTPYKDKSFFVYENQCCYRTYYNYVDHADRYKHCFCLSDNCNDKACQSDVNAVGSTHTEKNLVVAIAMATYLMSEKCI